MKRLILLGSLSFLVAGSATQAAPSSELFPSLQVLGRQPAIAAVPTASSVSAQRRDVFYSSDRFGYRFVSPKDYIVAPSKTQPSTHSAKPLEVLELWQRADFLNRASLPETPPLIRITIYNNVNRLPLNHWKGELSRKDDRSLTVAGQKAIAYTSTGLYEYDNVLLSSPDGRYVFRLTGGYMNAKAPIRNTFRKVVSSFTFDVKPDSTSPSQ